MEVNNEPQTALRILEYAASLQAPAASPTSMVALGVPYIKAMSRVLLRLGQHAQLQWLFATALEEGVASKQSLQGGEDDAEGAAAARLSLREEAEVWEEYYRVEAALGLASPGRMQELRRGRVQALMRYEDELRARAVPAEMTPDAAQGAAALMERFPGLVFSGDDAGVKSRCTKVADLYTLRRLELEVEVEGGASARRRSRRDEILSADSLQHVSYAVKELVVRLPTSSSASSGVDVGAFLEQLRRLVLPVRPSDSVAEGVELSGGAGGRGYKRSRFEPLGGGDALGEGPSEESGAVDDVFYRRQRARLGKQ